MMPIRAAGDFRGAQSHRAGRSAPAALIMGATAAKTIQLLPAARICLATTLQRRPAENGLRLDSFPLRGRAGPTVTCAAQTRLYRTAHGAELMAGRRARRCARQPAGQLSGEPAGCLLCGGRFGSREIVKKVTVIDKQARADRRRRRKRLESAAIGMAVDQRQTAGTQSAHFA